MNELLPELVRLVDAAGAAVLAEYAKLGADGVSLTLKDDRSPFTSADAAAQRILAEGLTALAPEIPVLSEEGRVIPYAERAGWSRLWVVDPLDGTKEFLERNDEFTINVALIEHGTPVLGVLGAPALGKMYWGARKLGAFAREAPATDPRSIHIRMRPADLTAVVVSRSHSDARTAAFVAAAGPVERNALGSSLKFALVAEGVADLYPRFGPTMEWDVAAGDAILRAAGGTVSDLDGNPLRYNKPDLHNPPFVAAGDPALGWRRFL